MSKSTSYGVTVYATDKHPGTPDNRVKIDKDMWLLPVQIIEGFTELDRDTVTRILTIAHGARLENINPVMAKPIREDGMIDLDAEPIWL